MSDKNSLFYSKKQGAHGAHLVCYWSRYYTKSMPAVNTHKDPLESIIGDEIRAKMLRVFALNRDSIYTVGDFVKTLRKRDQSIRTALRFLERDGIIKKKKISVADQKGRRKGYGFNKRYTHQDFLEKIIRESMPTEKDILAGKIVRVPGVQYVVTTNVFIEKPREHIDLVIASSEDNEVALKELVQEAERVIGRELRCVFLTVNDLLYRIRMNDKFIREILEGGHRVHLDKVGLSK